MRLFTRRWLACGLLALTLCLLHITSSLNGQAGTTSRIAAARKDILELVAGKGDPKDLARKHSLEDVMHGFKLKVKDGIGVEGVAAPNKNGIEAQIIALSKTAMTKDELAKMSKGLIQMAEITKAIGRVGSHHKLDNPKDQADWDTFTKDLIQQSEALLKAIKSADPVVVKTAASKLNKNCTDCHKRWR